MAYLVDLELEAWFERRSGLGKAEPTTGDSGTKS